MKILRLMTLLAVVLFTVSVNAYTEETQATAIDSLKPQSGNEEISKVILHMAEVLKKGAHIWGPEPDAKNILPFWGISRNILVEENRMEFRNRTGENLVIYFSDIIDYHIHTDITAEKNTRVIIGGKFIFSIWGNGNSMKFYDDLILIQNQLKKQLIEKQNSELILFEPIAAQYRTLNAKPTISEAQREFIVQANSFNQQRMYFKAIELYLKAVELHQTAYPAAYSNLALLSAQVHKFDAAIYYMKKYLMLEPEASDARGAQDKIYEWKAQLSN